MQMTLKEYLAGLKGKTVAVIGIGVSNTPLIKMLLRTGIRVTACDKNRREDFGGLAEELESLAIWGYISLDDNKDTVYGTFFDHQGETPGLGAEITTPEFNKKFRNKQIFSGYIIW